MKKLLYGSMVAVMVMSMYGCPVGIDYPLGKLGKEKIEKKLIGTWICNGSDPEIKKVKISKNDDYSYKVEVLERGEMYSLETDNLTGWVTELDGKTFFYAKAEGDAQYYHYQYFNLEGNKMTTCDVSLLDGGIDAVTSTETFRTQVASSMKKAEFCDETLAWTKE